MIYENNVLVKALAYRGQARILWVENTELVRTACQRHPMHMVPGIALGKTISAASLLTGMLKDNQRISMKIKTSRRSCKILADADAWGNVRGYLSNEAASSPPADLHPLSLEQWIGPQGCLQLTKDIGLHGTFTGITDMPFGTIADDLSYYFQQSEQTPTFFSLPIETDKAGTLVRSRGVMAQLLPGAPYELIERIKHDLACSNVEDLQVVGRSPVRLFCGCSKEMLLPMLRSLDKEEWTSAFAAGPSIEIVCHICGKSYRFQPDELATLFGAPPPPSP